MVRKLVGSKGQLVYAVRRMLRARGGWVGRRDDMGEGLRGVVGGGGDRREIGVYYKTPPLGCSRKIKKVLENCPVLLLIYFISLCLNC